MIQTISPNDDLVLDVVLTDKSGNVIEEELIANLQFVVYTEQTSELQRVYLSKTRYNEGKLHINSSELATLSSGQLYLTTAIALLNSQYNDGSFDYIKTSALPYYLRNSAISVSDDEAILKWKIDVTKSLQNIDEALRNLSTRLYTIEGMSGSVEALEQALADVLSQYATIQYVDEQDASLAANIQPEVDLTPYATTEDVSAAISAIPQPDLTPYALKTAIPSLVGYATEQYVDEHDASVANSIPSVAGLATETYVTEQVGNIDLTPYATTEDVSTALADKADKNEIPSLEGYATEAYVDASINAIPAVDLTPYATTADVSVALAAKADTTDIPNLDDYVTKEEIGELSSLAVESTSFDYIYNEETWNESFANGALKKYYTKYPDEDRYNTQAHRWAWEADKVNGEWPEYCVQCWEGAISADGAKFPWICPNFNEDVNAKITFQYEGLDDVQPWGDTVFGKADGHKEWGIASVGEEFQNNSFLIPQQKNGQEIYNGNANWAGTEGDKSFDISKFKMVLINLSVTNTVKSYVESVVGAIPQPDLTPYATTADVSTALADKADKNEIPSLEGYATDASVAEAIGAIPQPDLTPYATTADVSTALADKADKNEIPSLEGYATDASVVEAIGSIDLTPYATTADVSTALATKADTSVLDNYVTDTSLGEILDDYVTDSSLSENYINNSQMENVELTVATAVNRLEERVTNIETTLLDEDSSTGDSSTGDSSISENGMVIITSNDVNGTGYSGAVYTLNNLMPTQCTISLPEYQGMPASWMDVIVSYDNDLRKEDPMMPGMIMSDFNATVSTTYTIDSCEISLDNLTSGAHYQHNITFSYNDTNYAILVDFYTMTA